jgi:Metallo-peptidase family M12B Reprolysin-like/Calx-beta domain
MHLFRLLILTALLIPTLARAELSADGVWGDADEGSVAAIGTRTLVPTHYRLLSLDRNALNTLLSSAPLEKSGAPGIEVVLPMPEGEFAQFSLVESPIMAPELAAKFPELKTYLATGIDDPTASLRLSVTPQGLHAQILSAAGALYIDPYQSGDDRHHISYARKDYTRTTAKTAPFTCHFSDLPQSPAPASLGQSLVAPQIISGTQRRTYRTAIAATGEYTAFHGGTVAGALAAIVVALNRVNGIYERDLAVRMVLVANNNLILYTNGATDPYTNDDGFAMLAQNQTNLNAVLGSANYDVGHVFSTGGGGVAFRFGPCNASIKAQGVTGLSSPTGDPFYIDYVAHEIGHQFGANHTFNSVVGACGGGNRNASTAYEPGSGSTIMGYAGICGADDLQPNSDADFHGISIEEMVKFTTGQVPGFNGDACAVKANTSNTPPAVDAGPNSSPAFTIPKSTPFQLTGTASDVNGDALTYDWEEFDLGPAGAPNTPSGNAPIFRSFLPSTSRTRMFPKLTNLLTNTQTIGELLPTYARALNFRLTVRDNRAGGGGINQDTIALQVSGSAGPFQVTAPNTAVTWVGSTTQTVTWNVAGTTAAPINCASVNLLLSTDGGNTFPTTILAGTPNDGSQAITVPSVATTQARLKVACANNVFFDISNTNFVISRALRISDVIRTEGNIGTSLFTFIVTLSPASTGTVTVNYATANGSALAGSDYTAVPTTALTFTAGLTSRTVTVPVIGNTGAELNETFFVNLSAPSGAAIADGQGLATILNDDGPVLRITDVSKAEGNSPTITAFTFNVTLSPASASPVTVKYVTANGTAVASGDYTARPLTTVTFAVGETTKPVTVNVIGDATVEANETFFVNLSAPTGATIFDSQGVGTILNDDPPALRITNVSKAEGNSSVTAFVFTVTMSAPKTTAVTVNHATANGTAVAPGDYTARPLTQLTFAAGEVSKALTVNVTGDAGVEANETFAVNLSSPVGATIADSQGLGTILNDD